MADISKSRPHDGAGDKSVSMKSAAFLPSAADTLSPFSPKMLTVPSLAQTNTPALSDENGTKKDSWDSKDAPNDHALTPETRSPAHTASAQAREYSSFRQATPTLPRPKAAPTAAPALAQSDAVSPCARFIKAAESAS